MQQALGQDGRYRIVRRIDAGGMGEIWEADDTLLGRRVAIKVLAEELAGDRVAVRRFRREARATAKLDHPNVIRVFDFVDGEAPFLVLELLEGQTLADRLRRDGALPPAEAARIAASVADGLDVAHRAGIIHRDIKPSNIMLTASGGVKVMDFGIAAAWEAHSTTGQQLLATAAYAPPERISSGRASPRGTCIRWGWCCTRCSPAGRRLWPTTPNSCSAPIWRTHPGQCVRWCSGSRPRSRPPARRRWPRTRLGGRRRRGRWPPSSGPLSRPPRRPRPRSPGQERRRPASGADSAAVGRPDPGRGRAAQVAQPIPQGQGRSRRGGGARGGRGRRGAVADQC